MSAGTAQPIAFAAIADIFEGSGIEKKITSVLNHADAQDVSVRMPSLLRFWWPGIDQHLLRRRFVRHQVDAAVRKSSRKGGGLHFRQGIKIRQSLRSQ